MNLTTDIYSNDSTITSTVVSSISYEYDLIDYLNMVITPIAFLTGVFGNLITVIVMSTHRFNHFGSRYFLIALAVADLSVIFTHPLKNMFIVKLFGYDIRSISLYGCKIYFGIHKTGKMTSSWIVACLAIERLAAIRYPFKVKQWFTHRKILIGLSFIILSLSGFNAGYAYFTEIDSNGICNPDIYDRNNSASVTTFRHFLNAGVTLYFIGPLAILLTIIPVILISLVKIERQRAELSSIHKSISTRPTIMLLSIMFGYILFVSPIGVVRIIVNYSGANLFAVDMTWFSVFRNTSHILEIINYAINFFLYVCSSKEFRDGVKDLICRR